MLVKIAETDSVASFNQRQYHFAGRNGFFLGHLPQRECDAQTPMMTIDLIVSPRAQAVRSGMGIITPINGSLIAPCYYSSHRPQELPIVVPGRQRE